MKILVIGKSGQIARSLADQAKLFSHELECKGRPELDLQRPSTIKQALSVAHPDIVINAAAFTKVDAAEDDPDTAYEVNSRGSGHLAEFTNAINVPLIHISTDYVFDGILSRPYKEGDNLSPLGVYGDSKAQGELEVEEKSKQFIVLRTAWVFSPYGQNFAKTMLRAAQTNDELRVVSDQVGTPTYAPYIAEAILRICDQIEQARGTFADWGTFHMVAEGQTNWADFAEKIFEFSARKNGPYATVNPIPTTEYPTKAKRPAYSCLSTEKLSETFNIRLPHWETGVKEFIETHTNL